MKHSEQINEIAAAMAKAQGQFTNLEKNRTVKVRMKTGGEYTFDYATYDEMIQMVRPHLSANGLAIVQGVAIEAGLVIVSTMLLHSSGQWLSAELPLVPDNDSPQSVGSCMTYGRRYLLSSLLCLASEDDDDGNVGSGHTPAVTDRKPASRPAPAKAADMPDDRRAVSKPATDKEVAAIVHDLATSPNIEALDMMLNPVKEILPRCTQDQRESIIHAGKARREFLTPKSVADTVEVLEQAYDDVSTEEQLKAVDARVAKVRSLSDEHRARLTAKAATATTNVMAGAM